jgi:aquaporin Z
LAELAGTTILVFGVLSVATLMFRKGSAVDDWSQSTRLLLLGAIIAVIIILIATSPIGRRSGAHINPAVTFGFWITGHVHQHDLGGYWVAQLTGGLLGAGLLRLVLGSDAASVGYGVLRPDVSTPAAAGIEAGMTAALVLTMFAFLSSASLARWTPVAAGAVVALAIWKGAPATGTGINPARALGPNVLAGEFPFLEVYVVGPLAGACFAAVMWKLVPRVVLTAKLYHDETYPCAFRTHLPAPPGDPALTRSLPAAGPQAEDD